MLSGTPVMLRKRYMALSKLPKKILAPVRKRFPVLAVWKLKHDLGRCRLISSRFRRLKKDRINSRFSDDICQCAWLLLLPWMDGE